MSDCELLRTMLMFLRYIEITWPPTWWLIKWAMVSVHLPFAAFSGSYCWLYYIANIEFTAPFLSLLDWDSWLFQHYSYKCCYKIRRIKTLQKWWRRYSAQSPFIPVILISITSVTRQLPDIYNQNEDLEFICNILAFLCLYK